ncbi:DUF6146 family protein [Aureitalea marina]|uniref:Lipoprotein n=1 Tax=Aureitalea marina TaxID=930804 RepID=A0A2S7KPH3_9FLAO|nr:DUF6146 family protein [Aureitalea marina]PQB04478.1 hypothetical protein BST85_05860 [Aureitalea marina]
MRSFLIVLGAIITMASCNSTKNTAAQSNEQVSDTIRIANDSLEYEIIIIENGFYNWLVTQFPEEYYSLGFLENQNRFYVAEYNRRVINPLSFDKDLYIFTINYDPKVSYGKEVNYLLYNYFLYFERTYDQKLK